jgi:hypothetical protein
MFQMIKPNLQMIRTKSQCINYYSSGSTTTVNVEAYSNIKNILYSNHNNMITLIYEYDDTIIERNKIISIKIINSSYFDEDCYLYKYWGTSIENRGNLSANSNSSGYGTNTANINLSFINEEIYSHIFYNEMKPLEETRDLIISDIID